MLGTTHFGYFIGRLYTFEWLIFAIQSNCKPLLQRLKYIHNKKLFKMKIHIIWHSFCIVHVAFMFCVYTSKLSLTSPLLFPVYTWMCDVVRLSNFTTWIMDAFREGPVPLTSSHQLLWKHALVESLTIMFLPLKVVICLDLYHSIDTYYFIE